MQILHVFFKKVYIFSSYLSFSFKPSVQLLRSHFTHREAVFIFITVNEICLETGKITHSGKTILPSLRYNYHHLLESMQVEPLWKDPRLERPLFSDMRGGLPRQVSLYSETNLKQSPSWEANMVSQDG